jgi:hypothetical protein
MFMAVGLGDIAIMTTGIAAGTLSAEATSFTAAVAGSAALASSMAAATADAVNGRVTNPPQTAGLPYIGGMG